MITLHITMQAKPEQADELVRVFAEAYVPAIRSQRGFRRAMLLREHERRDRFGIDIYFDTEADRLRWVESAEHVRAWPKVEETAQQICWAGYDVMADAGP
jgi:heme-degrading monooxygenase HmoA